MNKLQIMEEIFGTGHIWTMQYKKFKRVNETAADLLFKTCIAAEKANIKTDIINLQKRLDKLNSL